MSLTSASDRVDESDAARGSGGLELSTEQLTSCVANGMRLALENVRVLKRERNPNSSTSASEIITVEICGSTQLKLLGKLGPTSSSTAFGARGGVDYEAHIYEQVLSTLTSGVPRYYGCAQGEGHTLMLVEFIDGATRISHAPIPDSLLVAARWLGQFHRVGAEQGEYPHVVNLFRYDRSYLAGWAHRTKAYHDSSRSVTHWLAALVRKFEQDLIELLLAPDQVLIHGEFYPNNILYRGGAVTPIDWESAALALGSIDLVCLVEGWPPDLAAQCVEVYCIERWGGNRPQSFGAEFLAATAYVHFRWLGDRPEWTNHPDIRWRFDSLREIGASLGIK